MSEESGPRQSLGACVSTLEGHIPASLQEALKYPVSHHLPCLPQAGAFRAVLHLLGVEIPSASPKLTAKVFYLRQAGADISAKADQNRPRQESLSCRGLHAALFSGTIAALLRLLLILHKATNWRKLHLLRRKTGRKLMGALVAAVTHRGVAPVRARLAHQPPEDNRQKCQKFLPALLLAFVVRVAVAALIAGNCERRHRKQRPNLSLG